MLLYFSNTKDTGDIQKGMSFLNIYIRPKVYKHPANPNIFDIFSTNWHIKLSNYQICEIMDIHYNSKELELELSI